MALDPETTPRGIDALELVALTGDLLAEVDDLACPSVPGFVEYLMDRWPDRPEDAGQ